MNQCPIFPPSRIPDKLGTDPPEWNISLSFQTIRLLNQLILSVFGMYCSSEFPVIKGWELKTPSEGNELHSSCSFTFSHVIKLGQC